MFGAGARAASNRIISKSGSHRKGSKNGDSAPFTEWEAKQAEELAEILFGPARKRGNKRLPKLQTDVDPIDFYGCHSPDSAAEHASGVPSTTDRLAYGLIMTPGTAEPKLWDAPIYGRHSPDSLVEQKSSAVSTTDRDILKRPVAMRCSCRNPFTLRAVVCVTVVSAKFSEAEKRPRMPNLLVKLSNGRNIFKTISWKESAPTFDEAFDIRIYDDISIMLNDERSTDVLGVEPNFDIMAALQVGDQVDVTVPVQSPQAPDISVGEVRLGLDLISRAVPRVHGFSATSGQVVPLPADGPPTATNVVMCQAAAPPPPTAPKNQETGDQPKKSKACCVL
mmetsp:Transcript_1399/g.3107  ORF Transcript_1399/g.3107 Transcript_1399/m.3107 type:complete len:336 (-) Transcript_1399:589-1596(-)